MAEYEERYEGNGDHANVNHGEMADLESQNKSPDYERGSSKCIERETEKGRSRTRDGDQDRDGSRARDRDIGSERDKDRDRERDRDKDLGRERDKDRDREPNRDRDFVGEREKDRDRENRDVGKEKDRDRERDKHKEIDRERDKHRDIDRGRDRERDKERGRDREHDRERDRDRDRERDKDLDRHRSRDRDRNDRDREITERRENHHSRDDDDDGERHRSRERDRHRSYDKDRESRHRHRSHSRSRGRSSRRSRSRDRSSRRSRSRDRSSRRSRSMDKSSHRSRSRSRSRSKSKRVSGFDLAPPAAALIPGVSLPGQISGAMSTPVMPGMFPHMTLMPGQVTTFSLMPMQTQPATLHARRVYVGGIPPSANEQTVATFFSQVMQAIGGNAAGPGNAVVNVYINHDKKFAFVEMRSVEEASNAMALDGIHFEGAPVKVRRPSDYNPSLAAALGPSQPNPNLNLAAVGLTPGSAGGLEGPDRIFVGGLPYYFTESQVRELLESFGALRGFDLVKDRETGNSKGYAFCVYQDVSVTDIACAALNGIKMGDKTLTVRRANQGVVQPRPEQEIVLLQAQQQVALQRLVYQAGSLPTKVVCLTQVVSPDELKDDEEYNDILEDMREEAGKYGNLVNIVIPRPGPNGELLPGVGKVYLEYVDTVGSAKAKVGLDGRKFGGNKVVAVFYPENKFAQGEYDA